MTEHIERFTPESRRILFHADGEARKLKHRELRIEHLLLGMLHEDCAITARLLRTAGVDYDTVRHVAVNNQQPEHATDFDIELNAEIKQVLEASLSIACQNDHHHIRPEHLLLAVIEKNDSKIIQQLSRDGIDMDLIAHLAQKSLRDNVEYDNVIPIYEQSPTGIFDTLKRLIGR